jgi:phage virion morphogenesis protein
MTGVSIRIDGRDEALATLRDIAARAEKPRQMFDEIGASLVVSTQRRFELGKGPDGSPWPPSYRALAQGGKTLLDTARLFQSLTHVASDSGVEVGTNVLYAGVHQFGATIAAKSAPYLHFKAGGRWAKKKSVTIPARPFLGVDDEDEAEILAIAGDYILPGAPR